jgi:hypothetical protein
LSFYYNGRTLFQSATVFGGNVKRTEDGIKDGLYVFGYDDFDIDTQLAWGGIWFAVFRKFQLQLMVKQDDESWIELETRFNNFATNPSSYEKWTAEQRWLAFVMKEKFNKVWNGREWK